MEQEQEYNYAHDTPILWHTALQQYLIMPPNRKRVINLFIKMHPTFTNMSYLLKPFFISIFKYYVNTLMDILEQSPEAKEIITSFYKNCITYITQ